MYLSENYLLMNEWNSEKNKELKLEAESQRNPK